ncbi:MAG: hypothetical protein OHK0045_07220 [Raineya sp.]
MFCFLLSWTAQSQNFWQALDESKIPVNSKQKRFIRASHYKVYRLDVVALKLFLQSVPAETEDRSFSAQNSSAELDLPLPQGGTARFRIAKTPLLHPQLAAQFPEIQTFEGYRVGGYGYARLDFTYQGFHALIFTEEGQVYIDPYRQNDQENYLCYAKKNFLTDKKMQCEVFDEDGQAQRISQWLRDNTARPSGTRLLTYRTAVAATGEYTAFHGGTVPAALSAITTTMNRNTGIYQIELSIRFQLIANNNLIIYTNPATDPYTNNNGGTMLSENQTNIDNVIGSPNYDIGHVFSTGGGGIAGLGVVCRAGQKARGVTGSSAPIGDPFDVDYVAHEMGHQFGATHTFNSNTGSCNGNRSGSTAYEPGSGVTIMAYAGICGADNIASNSIEIFHVASFDQIFAYTRGSGPGAACPNDVANGTNQPPVPTVPSGGWVIPINTPFQLTGSATDPNNDPLTYCWEQYDLGPAGAWNSPSGNAPIFRSFLPSSSPTRTFPRLSDIIANNLNPLGERLPSYSRTLTFRMSVRDGIGGYDYATLSFSANAAAGPFLVTYPNTALTWLQGSQQIVTWDVARTNLSPVNCQNVHIRLSTDGGLSYPITLANNVPNNGSAEITVPIVSTSQARVRIEAANNIFFDISDANFTISSTPPSGAPTVNAFSPPDNSNDVLENADLKIYFNQNILKGTGNILLKRYADNSIVESIDVTSTRVSLNNNVATLDPINNLEQGIMYYVEIPNTAFRNASNQFYAGTTNKDIWNFSTSDNAPPLAVSLEPANNSQGVALNADLRMTFNEPINKGSGTISIRREDNSLKQSIVVGNPRVVVDNSIVTIDIDDLEANTTYFVEMPATTFRDLANNNFAGISGNTTWKFSTNIPAPPVVPPQSETPIYPNPTAGILKIDLASNVEVRRAEVWNVLGQKIYDVQMQNKRELSLQGLPSAIYILRLETSEETFIQRIVKK